MIEILHMGQHSHAPCLGLGKSNFSTTLCSELDLGVFMNFVGMNDIFKYALVSSQEDIHNLSYNQNTAHRSCCVFPENSAQPSQWTLKHQ